jgi:filamentous hemagglutinin family protein
LFLASAVTLGAQPTGGTITAGAGTITAAGGLTQVNQTSDRLIVDWNSFSIPQGATVNFAQPGALAAVLNRVTGADASVLLGTLSANGQVYLLNSNGILIGPSGRVETAGFLAATARLSDADFLRGTGLALTGGTDAAVVNQGRVSALGGDIVFVARRVQNDGTLVAPTGTVQLVGGTEVLLATPGSPALIKADSQSGEVENSATGAIAAAQVRLRAVGHNAAALAINQAGLIRATGIESRGGEVWLVGTGPGRVVQQGEISARSCSWRPAQPPTPAARRAADSLSSAAPSGGRPWSPPHPTPGRRSSRPAPR